MSVYLSTESIDTSDDSNSSDTPAASAAFTFSVLFNVASVLSLLTEPAGKFLKSTLSFDTSTGYGFDSSKGNVSCNTASTTTLFSAVS